jgi:CRISPR-associated protein Csd1
VIIDALYRYYCNLVQDPDSGVPTKGYSTAKVFFAFNLSESGDLLDVIPLAQQKGKKTIPMELEAPEPQKRTVRPVPNFLCDNSTYIIGIDTKGNPERTRTAFELSRDLHCRILGGVDDPGARAVCAFFGRWRPEDAKSHPVLYATLDDVIAGGNIVFKLDRQSGYIHERPKIKAAWIRYLEQNVSEITGQCLVTGQTAPIARLHPGIKGVRGAQSIASLVSFNLEAFESYGKSQGSNAPISEEVAFGYTTVLNRMLAGTRQKIQLDPNTTMVFWSESRTKGLEEDLIAELLSPSTESNGPDTSDRNGLSSAEVTQLIHDILNRVRSGQPIDVDPGKLDLNSRFYIFGLSPNNSRLSVRFWHVDSFGRLLEKVTMHHLDMEIERPARAEGSNLIPVSRILLETAARHDKDNIPPLLGGSIMRAVLSGIPYPQGLYTAIITRIRADHEVNHVRASVLKACLLRNARVRNRHAQADPTTMNVEVDIAVSLDEQNTNPAYRLGRLFAVLEKAQQDANPGLNSTIRDRYFGAASATPRAVFPQLLRLAQHHISKAEYGDLSDKRIEVIMDGLKGFPSHLSLEEQGLFMLGYYHQRQALYQKSEQKEG